MSALRLPRGIAAALPLALLLGGCVSNDISVAFTLFFPADSAAAMTGMCVHVAASS